MKGEITLCLEDLRFYAYHGWYEQETVQGQPFRVQLWVSYPEPDLSVEELDHTIDYTCVYELLKAQMEKPRRLLEDLAQSVLSELHDRFPQINRIRIHIEKTAPPVVGLEGRLGIQLERKY